MDKTTSLAGLQGVVGFSPVFWEYEDALPEMSKDDFGEIFGTSRLSEGAWGVRVYPYVKDAHGNKIFISKPNAHDDLPAIAGKVRRDVRISQAQFDELAALLAAIYAQPINPTVLDAAIKAKFLMRDISDANASLSIPGGEPGYDPGDCSAPPEFVWADYDPDYPDYLRWTFYRDADEQRDNRPDLSAIKFHIVPNSIVCPASNKT